MGIAQRLANRLARWRLVITVGVIVLAASVVMVARTDDSSPTLGTYVITAVLALIAMIVVINLLLQIAGVDAQASEIAERLAADSDQQRLLTRWLERARWARFIGGFCGLVVWLLGTRGDGNILVWGFGGIAVGALAAEVHHLRHSPGPRTARLEVRTVRNYLWPFAAWHMVGAAISGAALAALGLAVGELTATWYGAGALATIGLGHLAQRRVARRPRPALPDSLRSADDLARELAIERNVAWPCTYLALALVGKGAVDLWDHVGVASLIGVVLQVYAIGLWWRNRRLGLDFVLRERREPVLA